MTVGPDLQHERRARLRRPRRTEGGKEGVRCNRYPSCAQMSCVWERDERGRGKSHKFQSGMHSPGDRTLPLGAEANKYLMFNRRVKRDRDRHQHAAASLRAHVSLEVRWTPTGWKWHGMRSFFLSSPELVVANYIPRRRERSRSCLPPMKHPS